MIIRSESISCVCFDCDSTLSRIEGIDELAERAGCADKIVPLTTAAMEGRLAIEKVYAQRLEILKPSRDDLDWLGERYVATIVEGAGDAVRRLIAAGQHVGIVSGGLRTPVLALARVLGIAADKVRAVEVKLDGSGHYAGFDSLSPLTRSDGKSAICAEFAQQYGRVALVGDGVTDVAARAGGAYVIGFGGVVRREAVVRGADAFVEGASLAAVADFLLN